jgi:hypothetical protein
MGPVESNVRRQLFAPQLAVSSHMSERRGSGTALDRQGCAPAHAHAQPHNFGTSYGDFTHAQTKHIVQTNVTFRISNLLDASQCAGTCIVIIIYVVDQRGILPS